MKKVFVGIDVSKSWLDAAATLDGKKVEHQRCDNTKTGFAALCKWLKRLCPADQWLVCMEHTGLYAEPLWHYLTQKKITYCVVPGGVISSGPQLKRGKDDKIDACAIASFALRHHDELTPHRPPAAVLRRLKMLFGYRERLIKAKVLFSTPLTEATAFAKADSKDVRQDSTSLLGILEARIKKVERLMETLIGSDEQTAKCYDLILSVPGFGPVTAVYLLIITQSFTVLTNSRKLANFGGTAPHPHRSGTSIKGRTRVSPVADKTLKKLLSAGASTRLRYDAETRRYYERLCAKGKHKNLVKNNIKNKMLHTVCAVVKRGTPFRKEYAPLYNTAQHPTQK
jgi:transposase